MFYSFKHDNNAFIVLYSSFEQSFQHPRTIVSATPDMLSGGFGQYVREFR